MSKNATPNIGSLSLASHQELSTAAVGNAVAVRIPCPPSCRNAGTVDWLCTVIGSVRMVIGNFIRSNARD